MITPTSFAIHVTYTCPLTCAHCCFSSGPEVRDRLSLDHIIETIRSLDTSTIRMVAFTGGEAFLLGNGLVDIVGEAKSRGFVTRVVTSAYWAKHQSVAEKKLVALREAGLDELSISWDDFHANQSSMPMSFQYVHNAFWAAKKLGIIAAINIVQSANSTWTANVVKDALGIPQESDEVIVESPVNLTGRAEIELQDVGLRPNRYLGPCPYVLKGPTLSAKNKLLACCGVIPETDALVLDPDFSPENLDSAIEQGLQSPLLNWLYIRGPYAIMDWISKKYNIPIPKAENVGGNCEACKLLFETKEIADKIPDALIEKVNDISDELQVLDALGLLNKREGNMVLDLWMDKSMV